jgi:hypothetical protein
MFKLATTLLSGILVVLASDVLPRQNSSPLLIFNSLQELTACASASISWVYIGPDAVMTLQITNNGVKQAPPPSSSSLPATFTNGGVAQRTVPASTTIILSNSITPVNSTSFNWSQVTLPQGTYIVTASFPAFQYTPTSLPFFIQQSTDTSCLASPFTSTTTSTTSTSTSTSSSSSPSTTVLISTGSSTNTGAIAGGVVGGVVLLLGILALLFFIFRSKRSAHPPSSSYAGGGAMRRNGWGGLSSLDSTHGAPGIYTAADVPKRKRSKLRSSKPYLNGTRTVRQHSHPDSLTGPMVDGPSEEEIQSYRSPTAFPPSEEKFASSEEIVGMATLPPNASRRQSSLTESSYNEFSSGAGTRRRPSVNSTASLPPGARRPSIDLPFPSPMSTSSTNVAATPPGMDRASSGTSSQQEKKKTPRKPVPAYVPSHSLPPPPAAITTDSLPFIPPSSPLFSPLPPFIDVEGKAQRRSSGHYSLKGAGSEPQLNHKSSFGPGGVEGKPLHYLIPDMPRGAPS